MNKYPEITQKIVQTSLQLSGFPAFRTDYFSPGLGDNNIDIETIHNNLLYNLAFGSKPDTMDKHMNSIQKILESYKFHQPIKPLVNPVNLLQPIL